MFYFKTDLYKFHLLSLFFLLTSVHAINAQRKGLDPTFGEDGIVITDFGNSNNAWIWDMTLQPDNKILAAGFGNNGAIVLRYLPDGTLDMNFANNGFFTFPSKSGAKPAFSALGLQSNGQILLGGRYTPPHAPSFEKFLLIKLLPNGRPDHDFGTKGVDTTVFYKKCHPSAMAVQKDGKILLGGTSGDSIALARYKPDGGLDSSFGIGGMALIPAGAYGGNVANVELLPDGRILLGGDGHYWNETAERYLGALMLTRLLPDGSLDTTFNHTGQVYHRICNCYHYGKAMKRLTNGKILMAGYGMGNGGILMRLNEDGSLDTTFNHTGIATVDSAEIRANIVVGPDDKIWIGGTRNTDFAVYRFLPDGKIDSTFGENGKRTTKIQKLDNRIYAMALQPDGKMVAGGYTHEEYPTTRFKITLVRYLPDGKTGIITPTSKEGQISIYPNPANTYLLINNNTGESIQAITIYSVDGRKVKELTLQGGNRIPIRSLRPGIYTVHLHVRDKTIKKKLTIVQ